MSRIGKWKEKGKKKGIVLSQLRIRLRMAYQNRNWKDVEEILKWLKNSIHIIDVKTDVPHKIISWLEEAIDDKDWQKIEDLLQWLSDIDKNSPAYYRRFLRRDGMRTSLHSVRKRKLAKKG